MYKLRVRHALTLYLHYRQAPEDREIDLGPAWDALIDEEFIALGQARFEALIETKQHQ